MRRWLMSVTLVAFVGFPHNLFDWVNFGNPAANISNTNVGVITSADDPRIVTLSLRVNW